MASIESPISTGSAVAPTAGTTTFYDGETGTVLGTAPQQHVAVGDGVVGFGRRFRVADLWLSVDPDGPLALGTHVWLIELDPSHRADPTVNAMSSPSGPQRVDLPQRLAPHLFGD
jgi:hypothetical protein